MRVVFMGTPDFAVGTLKALIEAGHDVAAVVTQPYFGSSNTLTGRSCPNATTTITSGLIFLSSERNSSFFLIFSG